MHSLIIHMQGDKRRQPNAEKLLNQLPDAEILPAVRGADQVGHYAVRPGDLHQPRYPFALRPGELGCFLSHRAGWQKIVDEGWDHALIVEDDAAFEPGFWDSAQTLIARQTLSGAYIRLPAKARETGPELDREGDIALIRPRRIGLQTVAQIVGCEAAARLLQASGTIDRPVDTFLQMHWVTRQPVYAVSPSPVQELTHELGGSTIQKKTRASSKLTREIKRAVYRTRVALRPQTA